MTAFKPTEESVLHALQMGMAAKREDFDERFHEAFDGLAERGMIRPVYVVTDRARRVLEKHGKRHRKTAR